MTMISKNAVCPHCLFEYKQSWKFFEADEGVENCENCGKRFTYTRSTTEVYETFKAP